MAEPLLRLSGVGVRYGEFEALREIDLAVGSGGALGVIGESGAGKSTLAKVAMGLRVPDRGLVSLQGVPFDPSRRREQRKAVQMVFQDPYASLNPRLRIGAMLSELLLVNGLASKATVGQECEQLLELVGLPRDAVERRPQAFSGGQRQRIAIARALALRPALLVADEPVSALDLSVQASILKVLHGLRQRLGLSILLISHDLGVVQHLCEEVVVMRQGRIVERGRTMEVFERPVDPYTRELLDAASPAPPLDDALVGLLAQHA